MYADSTSVRAVLAAASPFAVLDSQRLARLSDSCRVVCLEAREVLLHDGQTMTSAFILVQGCLTRSLLTADGKSVLLNFTRPVTTFCCASVIDGSAHIGTVEARERSTVVAVPAEAILDAFEASPAFALEMARSLARSSVRQTAAIRELMFSVPVRLARLLCRNVGPEGVVDPRLSKAAMAEMLATVPETFSRALGTLRALGYVESQGRGIRVLDEAALRAYAQL